MDANSLTNASIDSATMENTAMDCAASKGALVKNKSRRGKNGFNFWIDILAFLTFLISTISEVGLMRSPGGHEPQTGLPNADVLWGLSRFEWAATL